MAIPETFSIGRNDPHPGAGIGRSIDAVDCPGEDPGMAATNRAISCRFQDDINHRRHSKPLMSLRQLIRTRSARLT
jgi:hypothetical protein